MRSDSADPDSGGMDAARDPIAEARALTLSLARSLAEGGARDEALAELEPERRRLGIVRPARLRPIARVWRLGALLLDASGGLRGTGRLVRAEQPARRSIVAIAAAEHRALQAAAMRGGYPAGETVNFDAAPILYEELDATGASGPLLVRDDGVFVRWGGAGTDAVTALPDYLADRAGLLLHPPAGA